MPRFFQIFLTKSFLGCTSLKTGTYVISVWNLLCSLGFAYYISSFILTVNEDEYKLGIIWAFVLTVPWCFIVCGILTSLQILCWLPTCNGECDSAKTVCYRIIDVYCLLDSAIYNALLAVFSPLIYACGAEAHYKLNAESDSSQNRYLAPPICVLLLLSINLYFALTEYSLYKAIKGKKKNNGIAEFSLGLVTCDPKPI